jgi:L-malate glycosyltransferase
MRVLFVEASSGGVVGGSLTGLQHLIRGLARERVQMGMALYEAKAIEPVLRAMGVHVYRIDRRRVSKEHALIRSESYWRARRVSAVTGALRWGRQTVRLVLEELPAALQLARIVRHERPHVMHLGNGVRANFDAILAARFTGTPVVCHVKGFEKYSRREQCAARRLDAVVCMTRAVHAHCLEHGVMARQNRVVYDAVDEEGFRPQRPVAQVRSEFGLDRSTPCIGIVGNIQEWKGQAIVVEAMARIRQHLPNARCLIIGGAHRAGTEYARALERRVNDLGLRGTVLFTGFRSDVADIMNALDVLVHASVRPEPFGRVILEAMTLGKPVVAAAAGGVPELMSEGETGFLVPPGDPEALATRLVRLLSDEALRRCIGECARARARERFSLEQHVATMASIYESVTRSH